MLNGFLLHLIVALGEAFDSSDSIIHEVINQVLIGDLLLVHCLAGQPHDHLAVIDVAGLHDFWELWDQRLFLEEQVMGAFLRIDQDPSHGLEEIVEDLFEVRGWIEGGWIREDVAVKNLQEELHINCWEPDHRTRVLDC